MFSRSNVLSITGLNDPQKCGKTLCEKAATRLALYFGEKKMGSHQTQLRRRHRRHEERGFSSHLEAAGAQEAAEQVTSLCQQFAQQVSLDCSATHGAVQHPPTIQGQTADVLLPDVPPDAVKDNIHPFTCEIKPELCKYFI